MELVKWNPRYVPLVVEGDSVRKITHKEIAYLKGIPKEYYLHSGNKNWLYEKLMNCSNVQAIQQIVSSINTDIRFEQFQKRQFFKGRQFEKIIISFFEQKGVNSDGIVKAMNLSVDFQVKTDNGIYSFDFKIYHNNYGIEDKVIAVCEKIYMQEALKDAHNILVIGNVVGREVKKGDKIHSIYSYGMWKIYYGCLVNFRKLKVILFHCSVLVYLI